MPTSQNRVWGTQNELWRASRRHVDFMVGSSSRRVTLFPGYVMKELAWAIALVPIIVLLGCGPSTDDIGRTVSLSMQEKFNSDPQFRDLHLTVQSVTVVHSSGNVYQGIAEVSSHGVTHEVMVKITSDGENTMWETEPGALLVFLSDRSSSLPQPYPGEEVSPPVFRPPRESTSVHQVPDYQSMNAAKLSTAVAQRMGFRYTNYPNGYMVDELCSSKMQGFCYPPNWQKWIVDLELKTIGEQADALKADSGAASAGNLVISWDSEQRVVFSGFRPHDSTSASAYIIVAPTKRELDIIWQRGDQITYLGPDSAILRTAHTYEWLKEVELNIGYEDAKEYERTHP